MIRFKKLLRENMKKIHYISILAAISLVACHSSSSNSTTNSSTLAKYKSMLLYTPSSQAQTFQLNMTSNNQQSFTVESTIYLTKITVQFFSNNNCNLANGGLISVIEMNGGDAGVGFPAGTYTSSSVSNYALCQRYDSGGCTQLYNQFIANSQQSMRFTYSYAASSGGPGDVLGGCMSGTVNSNYKETILDWSANGGENAWAACPNGSNCGFSQAYNVSLPSGYSPWSQLGSVPSAGYFTSIIQESGDIYAGGYSSTTNPAGGVWVWNSSSWSQLGSNITSVISFNSILKDKLSNNIIYAGGKSTDNVAVLWMWNGSSWTQVGNSIESAYQFTNIIQDDSGNIYASIQAATNLPQTAGVWKWNGSSWSELGGGNVESAAVFTSLVQDESGDIFAAGSAAGTSAAVVWKWDGSSWSQLGGNITTANIFRSILIDKSGDIYAAGTASISLFNTRGCVWKWDGSNWSQLGGANISSVSTFGSLIEDESGNIYAGGQSTSPNNGVVWKWDGSSWSQLGSNVTSASAFVSILRDDFGDLYAAGGTASPISAGLWLYHQ